MGLFDCGLLGIPFPVYDAVDRLVASLIGATGSILLWSLLCSAVVLFLYRLCSPQETLREIKVRMRGIQLELAKDPDDLSAILRLSKENIGIALKRFVLTLVPTCIAVIPLFSLASWMHSKYAYVSPVPREHVAVESWPKGSSVLVTDMSARSAVYTNAFIMTEDATGIELADVSGSALASISFPPRGSAIAQKAWWSLLLGNPLGYLPDDAGVSEIHASFPRKAFLPFGPHWLRGWETVFIGGMTVFSLIMKLAFKIE